jgi:hypothetical protein
LGAQASFEIEIQWRRRRFRRIGNSADRSAACDQDDSGLLTFALELCEHRIGAGSRRKVDPDIEPLCNRNRKYVAADRLDLEAVDGDEFAIKRAQPDVKGAHRRAVDDAQKQPSSRLDLDDLRVGERAGNWRGTRHI